MFQNLQAVSKQIADAMIVEEPLKVKQELGQIISHLIEGQSSSPQKNPVTPSFASAPINKLAYNDSDADLNDRDEKDKDFFTSPVPTSEQIQDSERVQVCSELRDLLQAELQKVPVGGDFPAFQNWGSIMKA